MFIRYPAHEASPIVPIIQMPFLAVHRSTENQFKKLKKLRKITAFKLMNLVTTRKPTILLIGRLLLIKDKLTNYPRTGEACSLLYQLENCARYPVVQKIKLEIKSKVYIDAPTMQISLF